MTATPPRKAAFIDRDGVINEERGFVHRAEDFIVLPGVFAALQALQSAGFVLVVITNQSGIARGMYSEGQYLSLTQHMRALLLEAGISIAGIYHCPHLPDAPLAAYRRDCECRKPRSGLIRRALADLNLDPAASILIGDRDSDIAAGRAAAVGRCFLVRSGVALGTPDITTADAVYDDIGACVRAVLSAR